MSVSKEAVAGCRASHERLIGTVATLGDTQVAQPSALPGWTVGHVLTHLARNADSVVHRLDGALANEIVDQYPGGATERASAIESGATRDAATIVADVIRSSNHLDERFASMPEEAWPRLTRNLRGQELPAHTMVWMRWREVEVHHVDLALGYEPKHWPQEMVDRSLLDELPALPERCDPRALLAWMLGRGDAPEIAAY
jgi:maleylpyruvate isomerase